MFYLKFYTKFYHHLELHNLLSKLIIKPNIIWISETWLQKGKQPITNISLPNYVHEHTPNESGKGGTLLYVDKPTFICSNLADFEHVNGRDEILYYLNLNLLMHFKVGSRNPAAATFKTKPYATTVNNSF